MNMMIALVGGQPLPNLIPVRYYQPNNVLLVYTETTKKVYERLCSSIEPDVPTYGLKTDSYNVEAITVSLQDRLQQPDLSSHTFLFNLTGGTKAMALAAYQVAQQYNASVLYIESEGKKSRAFYYTWFDHQLQGMPSELIPGCLTLDDFLNVYLGVNNWQEYGPGRGEGHPFETALAETLRAAHYEVMIGVKTMNGQIDLDIVARWDNRFGIVEAKVGENGRKLDGIKQLNNAIRQLGIYTQQFYAITVEPNQTHDALVAASGIKVITLPGYQDGTDILNSKDAEQLIDLFNKTLKG
ncbi:MAG: DUF1887 family protein [Chloroflexi bacterium AL-W]|nr:DUF1887 family protein [Chloroflexi bacterium AL-N1]NOK66643.1 DUF1887 family protein [Chloroflexi bacterium AL-N10]NOK72031.1 DUF1887 family protein [Chloroflexi bacterium AL-N5]NOK81288.1 DUF1887 family protein [Chloroflexi bacterium AL-W]NOK89561.1 DUF1887 family protein [Chloroflexi bacterium AL-N15]